MKLTVGWVLNSQEKELKMPEKYKLAALRLNSLSEADRGWILSRLPVSEKERILEKISDLKSLGIEKHRNLIDEILENSGKRPASPKNRQDKVLNQFYERINWASCALIQKLFEGVPEELIVEILHEREWSWAAEYLQGCSNARIKRFEEIKAAKTSKLGQRARAVLIQTLSDKISELDGNLSVFDSYMKKESGKKLFSRWRRRCNG